MIIRDIIDCLSAHLSCYVGVQAPAQTTGYVLIDKTGSDTRNHITTSTIAVQCYGETLLDAIQLWERVDPIMQGELIKSDKIASVRLETDYNFTDISTKQYRWQAIYDITHYTEV